MLRLSPNKPLALLVRVGEEVRAGGELGIACALRYQIEKAGHEGLLGHWWICIALGSFILAAQEKEVELGEQDASIKRVVSFVDVAFS
jgi:hypothetical protein